MKNLKVKLSLLSGAVVAGLAVPLSAMAAIDVAVTTAMGEVSSDITTIGGLIITLAAVALGIRWVKATFF
jgi:hypothetical protein